MEKNTLFGKIKDKVGLTVSCGDCSCGSCGMCDYGSCGSCSCGDCIDPSSSSSKWF